jgi:hypothetical protein
MIGLIVLSLHVMLLWSSAAGDRIEAAGVKRPKRLETNCGLDVPLATRNRAFWASAGFWPG